MNKFLLLVGLFCVSFGIAVHFGVPAGTCFPIALLGLGLGMSAFGVWEDFDTHIKRVIRREVLEVLAEEREKANALPE